MTQLTTHVLDTMRGRPAAGINIEIYRKESQDWIKVGTMITNRDGRTDNALLQGSEFKIGKYQLIFYVGAYFEQSEDPSFLDDIVIRFGLNDPQSHIHVPLLVSPYSFSSYRGS
ncbi:5-hydroxyisourate hydrolase [Vibrio zhanjiangensis]|uniref:5-hydroxyisourate hydrolase n=1 Tax=Vibrio zhanjiangensis TaxID=1046128 RepID=A0ABQ6EW37_9VIBR|nr:hydroxyisourate hydrolase [Vibrio zhanjiangensis]GLT16906.1 5-hydroxyisourate hydrolase [Vibrio zhanjiangensis]